MSKIALAFGFLFCEDMAFESVFSFYFPGACELEPLLGAGMCFYLWHFDFVIKDFRFRI
jgi:hypothetical protein